MFQPCPVPVPGGGGGGGGGGKKTTPSTGSTGTVTVDGSNDADFLALSLGWIVPAVLLAMVLAGTLAYVLWRYCSTACARWRARVALRRK